ncbi:unnamed protein product [Larinioides sclopetarius]|uniref:Uncharacterized protein n=1 Tax=Larinioides sclopetarius TaxID=280406 RepID=A0AAV2AVR3_9ARAC
MDSLANFIRDLLRVDEDVAYYISLILSFVFGYVMSAIFFDICRELMTHIHYGRPNNYGAGWDDDDDEPPQGRLLIPNGSIHNFVFE